MNIFQEVIGEKGKGVNVEDACYDIHFCAEQSGGTLTRNVSTCICSFYSTTTNLYMHDDYVQTEWFL